MTKRIPLHGKYGKGKFALVDDADFEWLNQYRWRLPRAREWKGEVYAVAWVKSEYTLMHRLIMCPPNGLVVDHINHNPLDNRRENLRLATPEQNAQNRRPDKAAYSKYKGVSFHKATGLWQPQVGGDSLGLFATQWEAAKAYNEEAKRRYGRFAYLNRLPPEPGPDDPPMIRKAKKLVRNKKTASAFKGVRRHGRKWQAYISVDGEFILIGQFGDERLAGLAYDAAALKYYGNTATLNFPESWENPIDIDRPIVVQATPRKGGKNRYLGVQPYNNSGNWAASHRGAHLGTFPTEEEAARAYDAAAYAKGGKVIPLNFPSEWPNYHPTTPTGETHK